MSQSLKADVIINALKDQANTILSAALGSTKLESFNVGSKGNIPYYWQNPRNLEFNAKTYDWINCSLKDATTPLQLDELFTNLYFEALKNIYYSLSTEDQAKLNQAKANAVDQQGSVLRTWQEAYGKLPSAEDEQPIDLIASVITKKWADPPTTLNKIKEAKRLDAVLNNVPASGEPIVPIFANWLNALGEAVSLENNTTLNKRYLDDVKDAIQSPTKENGGLTLDKGTVLPAYSVSTQLADIVNGLKADQPVNLTMTVTRSTEDEFKVSIEGGLSFTIPVPDLFMLNVGGNAKYFQSNIATSDNETKVTMTFPGVTLVNFGPVDFNLATEKYWFWMEPIRDAIKNGDRDVSGFKFRPDPEIDFSAFGYLMGAAISNYPSMVITVKSANYERIQKTFEQSASVGLTFLGIPLGIGGKESTYSNKVTTDASNQSVTIEIKPPKELVAGTAVDSVGWILGVQPNYPAA